MLTRDGWKTRSIDIKIQFSMGKPVNNHLCFLQCFQLCLLLVLPTQENETQKRTENHIYPHGSALLSPMDKGFSIISLPAAQNAMIAVGIALHSGRARSPWPLPDRNILGRRILDLMLLLSADALPKSIRAWISGVDTR